MKKTLTTVFLALLLVFVTAYSAACSKQPLETPQNIVIDDSYRMTWEDVENSRGYTVAITYPSGETDEEVARRANYSLESLEMGDYEIRVKAVGDNGYADSPWSDTIYFHRDYENGCFYQKTADGMAYTLTSYGTATGDVDVGDTYRGKPVVAIGDAAFRSSRVTGVTIGSNVTTIGDNAFYGCAQMKYVKIPESVVSIGKAAFQTCYQLNNVVIPEGVTVLADSLFAYCRALSDLTIPQNITSIEYNALNSCSALTEFDIPDTVTSVGEMAFFGCTGLERVSVGASVESIGVSAFRNCTNLAQVEFSDSGALRTIGEEAFFGCAALQSVDLPEGLESIGNKCFNDCTSLSEATLPDSLESLGQFAFTDTVIYNAVKEAEGTYVYVDGWLADTIESKFGLIKIVGDESVPQDLRDENFVPLRNDIRGIAVATFYNNQTVERVYLPDSVEIVGMSAFSNCLNLWYFEASDTSSLRILDAGALIGCTSLRTVYLGSVLEEIGDYAFYMCEVLENNSISSIIPSTVTKIGMAAFLDTSLFSNPDEYGVIYAGDWVIGYEGAEAAMYYMAAMAMGEDDKAQQFLADMSKVTYVKLDSEVKGIADYAFYGHIKLEQADGVSSARYLGKGAFYGCENLSIVTLNTSLTEVKPFTFYGCASIFRVSLPPLVTSIGRSAFYGCTQLSEVNYTGTRLESVGDFAFYNCINLPSVNLGNALKDIGRYAFYNNTKLETIDLPDSVENIGDCAFYQCSGASSLTLGPNVAQIGDRAFAECTRLTSVSIPASVRSVGDYAFAGCTAVESLQIAEGVEEIGSYAFSRMGALQSVALPQSLTKLGTAAFRGCISLGAVTVRGNTAIGAHAFYGDVSATIYTDAAYDASNREQYWNSSYKPVLFGCVFSEEGYLVSFTVTGTSLLYVNESNTVSAPVRSGYTFAGWAVTEGGAAQYAVDELGEVPVGTTLYAVWQQA